MDQSLISPDSPTNNAWCAALPLDKQQFIASRYQAGVDAGRKSGLEGAAREIKLNRVLIPLVFVALAAGVVAQRFLYLIA